MRRAILACAVLAVALSAASPHDGYAQPPAETDTLNIIDIPFVEPNLGRKLDGVLESFTEKGYSGVVLVGWGGLMALHKAYGMADRESGIPNTVQTAFPIGPVTMQFTAAAILKLEREGRLRTSDSIADHLGPFPGVKSQATIHDLLTHTAGLVRDEEVVRDPDRDRFIQAVKDGELDFPPGSKHRVSAAGYGLLAAIIEKASGVSFETYLREKLFAPAGMRNTRFLGESASADSSIATGYVGGRTILPWLSHLPLPRLAVSLCGPLLRGRAPKCDPALLPAYDWTIRGGSGVVSTAGDLFRWELALRGNRILSEGAKEKLFTAAVEGQPYGWRVEKTRRGTNRICSGGSGDGFACEFIRYERYLRYVNKDLVVIVTVNNDMGWGRAVWMTIEDVTYGEDYSTPFAVLAILVLLLVVGGASRRTKRKQRGRKKWREYRSPPWERGR